MRASISLLLAALLVACPHLCQAQDYTCCADCDEMPADESREPGLPASDAVSCICAGALKETPKQIGLEPGASRASHAALLVPPSWLLPSRPHPLARDGAPPGKAPGGPLRVHLLLQNFRC